MPADNRLVPQHPRPLLRSLDGHRPPDDIAFALHEEHGERVHDAGHALAVARCFRLALLPRQVYLTRNVVHGERRLSSTHHLVEPVADDLRLLFWAQCIPLFAIFAEDLLRPGVHNVTPIFLCSFLRHLHLRVQYKGSGFTPKSQQNARGEISAGREAGVDGRAAGAL